jgi:ribosome maturation factor RimP
LVTAYQNYLVLWKWVLPAFFVALISMTHPLIPQIIDLATPIAQELGLEIVDVVFLTNKRPPVLRVDVRNLEADTSLDDCERMSLALDEKLDSSELIPSAYVLEISSPGISRELTTDREFSSFKGFEAIVTTSTPYEDRQEWRGKLQGRDEESVYLNQKGKTIAIPRQLVARVQLQERH